MTDIVAERAQPRPEWAPGRLDVVAALCVAVIAVAIALAAPDGLAAFANADGDNDSLMRMVEVRDLIAGQGWFDLTQYRLGLDGGVLMHWSRLVDAPIAGIVLAVEAVTGSRTAGEAVAALLWPSLLLAAGTLLLVRLARLVHGPAAALPGLVVGGIALMSIGIFRPGAIDHHNVQLVLTLAMALGLLAGTLPGGLAAGAAAAVSIAIGMETLPHVAVGGLIAGGLFLVRGRPEAPTAIGFGLGFAATAAAAFVVTVPARQWLATACDAYSVAQGAVAVLAGLGLALAAGATPAGAGVRRRLVTLSLLGLAIGCLVVLAFPQCLADPYAGLDARLKTYWLSSVTEARSIIGVAAYSPAMLITWYATPLLGAVVLMVQIARLGWRRQDAVIAALLATSILIGFWQIRGTLFAVPLAVLPLVGWITARRTAALMSPSASASLAMALAWVLSMNVVWGTAADYSVALFTTPEPSGAVLTCDTAQDYAQLAALPATTVLSISNLGPGILKFTPHRALSGPYHRNVAGNLAVLDMFMASTANAAQLARGAEVGIVALCAGNSETRILAQAAPDGLIAGLAAGAVPAWLAPIETPADAPLRLFRVVP